MSAVDRSKDAGAAGVVAFTLLLMPSLSCAQEIGLNTRPGIELGLNASSFRYEEPSVSVTEKGYTAGADFALTATPRNDWFIRGDGRLAFGENDYSGSGSKGDNPYRYAELRGTFGKDFYRGSYGLSPYLGVGYRYAFDDLRGATSTGAVGYRRKSQYIYIPIGVTHRLRLESGARLSTTFEFDYLVHGRQRSQLSDATVLVPDQTNHQHSGYGIRASMYYEKTNWSFGPWIYYWRINQSETTSANVTVLGTTFTAFFYEPRNRTVEVGLRLGYKF